MTFANNPGAAEEPYGYLLVHFLEDPDGYAERIYMDLSDGDNPHRWIPLNGGEPLLTSTIGTTGVRDPHITRNPETGVWTIVATDLRVFGGAEGLNGREMSSWHHWSRHGSTDLMVWQSDDLIHWTGPHTLDVARRPDGSRLELGMAWACESLWVPDYYPEGHDGGRGAFVIYWSSTVFPDDDRDHTTADVRPQVLWGVTRDFTQDTYEYGGVFIDTGGDSIDTTMIQRPLPDGGRRTYRITKDNAFGNGIWMDSTDAPRWWEPGTPWTTVQTRIGAEYAVGGDPGGVEGPAAFASHSADEWYLFVDVIPEIGYRPLVTDDLDAGWRPLQAEDYYLSPHTKHGGVIGLTRADYERVREALL